MTRVALPMLSGVLALPAVAWGAADGGPTLLGSLAQTLGALAVVIGIILLFSHAANRWFHGGSPNGRSTGYIRLVETRYLAPKKALMLVEVGGEYLLLSTTADGMQLVKQIDMLEDIEVVETVVTDQARSGLATSFRERLAAIPGRLALAGTLRRGLEALR